MVETTEIENIEPGLLELQFRVLELFFRDVDVKALTNDYCSNLIEKSEKCTIELLKSNSKIAKSFKTYDDEYQEGL